MKREDMIRKLTSRKLWMALALFVSGLIAAFGGSEEAGQTVSGCIMQGAAVLGYLLAEGLADGKNTIPQSASQTAPFTQGSLDPSQSPAATALPEESQEGNAV